MPFKSEAQRRWMYAAEARGDVPKGTTKKWEEHTPKGEKLPEKAEKKASAFELGFEKKAIAPLLGGIFGKAVQSTKNLATTVGQKAVKATATAGGGISGWGTQLKRAPGAGGFAKGVGSGLQRVGQFVAKNPKGVAIGAGAAAGLGAVGLGAKMMGGPSQPPQPKFASAFDAGFKKASIEGLGGHMAEVAGLGVLAVPSAAELLPGHDAKHTFWTPKRKAVAEVGGLGILAVPSVIALAKHFRGH